MFGNSECVQCGHLWPGLPMRSRQVGEVDYGELDQGAGDPCKNSSERSRNQVHPRAEMKCLKLRSQGGRRESSELILTNVVQREMLKLGAQFQHVDELLGGDTQGIAVVKLKRSGPACGVLSQECVNVVRI
jgi:hypothetical protein